jgi:hypothetical protein
MVHFPDQGHQGVHIVYAVGTVHAAPPILCRALCHHVLRSLFARGNQDHTIVIGYEVGGIRHHERVNALVQVDRRGEQSAGQLAAFSGFSQTPSPHRFCEIVLGLVGAAVSVV